MCYSHGPQNRSLVGLFVLGSAVACVAGLNRSASALLVSPNEHSSRWSPPTRNHHYSSLSHADSQRPCLSQFVCPPTSVTIYLGGPLTLNEQAAIYVAFFRNAMSAIISKVHNSTFWPLKI